MKAFSFLAALLLATGAVRADVTLKTDAGEVQFNSTNGALQAAVVKSGEFGLWSAKFQDGREIRATDFSVGVANAFTCEAAADGKSVRLCYRSAALNVTVLATARANGVEFTAEVQPQGPAPLFDFALPARLRFDPAQVRQCVFPANGNLGVGYAFTKDFFSAQTEDDPAAWTWQKGDHGEAFSKLCGGQPQFRPDGDPAVPLSVTEAGRAWLGAGVAREVGKASAVVNRAPTPKQADLVLVDSANGPWLSANSLGGAGKLWRIGGPSRDEAAAKISIRAVAATVAHLARQPSPRKKIAVIALTRGPERGHGNHAEVREWQQALRGLPVLRDPPVAYVDLTTPSAVLVALAGDEFLAILNPYAEALPTAPIGDTARMVDAIGRFVRAGGHWFEVGGFPFHSTLRPEKYFHLTETYPAAFADFIHLDTTAGATALFGVQPLTNAPWAAAQNPAALFVPGALGCGGDERGGYVERAFGTFIKPGASWRSPAVRLTLGCDATRAVQDYCAANRIEKKLADKLAPATLDKFKQSVLLFYPGNCAEKLAHVAQLPTPAVVHFADYLKGGFDKEYPDHLPPPAWFGTSQQFRELIDVCHQRGLLVMPYTNPTWWCDHPRGPTFQREGETPLLRGADGKPHYETYHVNDGWTVCHWHEAVRRANLQTIREFTQDYPVDMLFQDQFGARGWLRDFNPASPTPYAYSEGLVSALAEHSARIPISTEGGWDRVANYACQLCALSWQLVPTEHRPEWARSFNTRVPPRAWRIFPLAQLIAHDKAALHYHDLGQFVTNPELVAWTLGLGFGMNARITDRQLDEARQREWLRWLDRLQKSVCARYTGVALRAFAHERPTPPNMDDDGVLRSTYGELEIVTNLAAQPRASLAAFGFRVTAPGLVAGRLKNIGARDFGTDGISFVAEGDAKKMDLWIFATAGSEVAAELPCVPATGAKLKLETGDAPNVAVERNIISFRLPDDPARKAALWLWHATLAAP